MAKQQASATRTDVLRKNAFHFCIVRLPNRLMILQIECALQSLTYAVCEKLWFPQLPAFKHLPMHANLQPHFHGFLLILISFW